MTSTTYRPLQLGHTHSLSIEGNVSPCAHTCRYCSIGDRNGGGLPLARYLSFVEGFEDWAKVEGPAGLSVSGGFHPSFNYDIASYRQLNDWYERRTGCGLRWIPLGGLKMRCESEMRDWLNERRELGLVGVSASFVGTHALHDRWNGRRGDFEFLMLTLRVAAEMGLQHGTTLFVTKSSLPLLGDLVELLDQLPTLHEGHHFRQFYYIGHGSHHEAERIAESDRDRIPEFARSLFKNFSLHTEGEWIEMSRTEVSKPLNISLHLELTRHNIDRLECTPYTKIFTTIDGIARSVLAEFPDLPILAERYGDPINTRLYPRFDIRRVWFERFAQRHELRFDRSALHYYFGQSRHPPRLWDLPNIKTSARM